MVKGVYYKFVELCGSRYLAGKTEKDYETWKVYGRVRVDKDNIGVTARSISQGLTGLAPLGDVH
jgi:hypothetical protein